MARNQLTRSPDNGGTLCYPAYQLSSEELARQRVQNALLIQLPDEMLATYYTAWRQCTALGHSPIIVEKRSTLATEARRLLRADGFCLGGDVHQHQRFCRLFQARGREQFPPFYDVFAQFWSGQDIVQVPDQPTSYVNVLPQPVDPTFPALAWVLAAPLPPESIVCSAWPIDFADGVRIPAGTLGRVMTCGEWAGNILWKGHPHLVLCLREMLMMPCGPLARKDKPPSVHAFLNRSRGSHAKG